ncbi:ribosomal maturation YjgA family protein [Vibrio cortegadensis]|uniref:ribosomal maturation YjgA family protein n=1 Tax=Vibrio cortegadensis TaxID=1328770 RepID=UPI00352D336B
MKMLKQNISARQQSEMNDNNTGIYFRLSTINGLKSFICFIALVVIALYVRDSFIRPTFGDVLVVVWLYYLLASILSMPVKWLAALVVLIAFVVEFGQLLQVATWLGIESSSILAIILGATFDWKDLFAYGVGGALCWWMEAK